MESDSVRFYMLIWILNEEEICLIIKQFIVDLIWMTRSLRS